MLNSRRYLEAVLPLCALLLPLPGKSMGAGVFTWHNDNSRTGANLNETVLTPASVNHANFGKLFSFAVDGQIYAQPLYVPNVAIAGQGTHNVVFVATEHDSVYAFDADGLVATPLWHVSFVNGTTVIPVPVADVIETGDLTTEIGITATPVIDPVAGILYVNAKTKETSGTTITYAQRLHALDLGTGAEKLGGPVVLQATVPGTGAGNDGAGHVSYNPLRQNQREALVLANGVVYIASASHGDIGPYHGWVLGYNTTTLQQVMAYNATPDGQDGGIWQSGAGAAVDSGGNLYVVTGNGDFNADSGGRNYGDTFLKISPSGAVLDFFTPFDQASLSSADLDMGSTGGIVLPDQPGSHPHLYVSSGKNGTLYLVDRDNMGHFNASNNNQIVQSIPNIFPTGGIGAVFDSPVYWNNIVYFSGYANVIKAFQISNGLFNASPVSQTTTSFGLRGAAMSVSANGTTHGILWAIEYPNDGATEVLHAYDATNLATELYNTTQAGARDNLGPGMKFTPPTIVNGKVYVAAASHLTVLGATALPSPCDVNKDGSTNVADVQADVNAALGVIMCTSAYDINKDTSCNIIDVQRVVNAALGGQCVSP